MLKDILDALNLNFQKWKTTVYWKMSRIMKPDESSDAAVLATQ